MRNVNENKQTTTHKFKLLKICPITTDYVLTFLEDSKMKTKFTLNVLALAVLAALPLMANAEKDDKVEKENHAVENAQSDF